MRSNFHQSSDQFQFNVKESCSNQQIKPQQEQCLMEAGSREKLYRARDQLRDFVNSIGTDKFLPLRQDVIDHCEKFRSNIIEILDYQKIQRMVKNRIQKMKKNNKIKKNWGRQDISILMWVVSKYCDARKIQNIQKCLNKQDWNNIAELIPGVNGQSCMFKWLSLKRNKLSDYSWSQNESITLSNLVEKYGQNDWGLISQMLYHSFKGSNKIYRCPKQCREHWSCFLNPKLKKGLWSSQQDYILLSQIRKKNGEKKWTQLAKFLDGRTQNALKNRYTLIISKQKQLFPNQQIGEIQLIDSYLMKNYISQFVSTNTVRQNLVRKGENIHQSRNKQQQYKPGRALRKKKHEKHYNNQQNKQQKYYPKRTKREKTRKSQSKMDKQDIQEYIENEQQIKVDQLQIQSQNRKQILAKQKKDEQLCQKQVNEQMIDLNVDLNELQKQSIIQNDKQLEIQNTIQKVKQEQEQPQKNELIYENMKKLNIQQMIVIAKKQHEGNIFQEPNIQIIKQTTQDVFFQTIFKIYSQNQYQFLHFNRNNNGHIGSDGNIHQDRTKQNKDL